jgi:hypothetical protein
MLRMSRLQLHPSLGTAVLQRLREFAVLPERGIVAGQAVASVLDHLQGLTLAPVNDIDVFRRASPRVLVRRPPSLIPTVHQQAVSLASLAQDYAALDAFLQRMRSYRVSTVTRDGLLNFVNCDVPFQGPFSTLTAARVIQSFDLNCVRVAVDLATGELVWDRHFESFLKHRHIEVCAVHTPWHTFIRALKKCYELPDVSMNLEAVAAVVTTFAQSKLYKAYERNGVISGRFGPKLQETAVRFRSDWQSYFSLDASTMAGAHRGQDFTVSALVPRGEADAALQRRVDCLHNASLHFAGPALHAFFRKPSSKVAAKVQALDDQLTAHSWTGRYLAQDPWGYTEGHLSPRHPQAVDTFLQHQPMFANVFAGLTLDEQYEAVKGLTNLQRTLPAWRFTLLAQMAQPADLRTAATIAALHTRLAAQAVAPLRQEKLALPPLPAPLAARGLRLRELNSIADFESSRHFGSRGTKPGEIRAGKLAILEITSFEAGKQVDTALEIALVNGRPVALKQAHRSPGRFESTPRTHRLVQAIVLARLTGSPTGRAVRRPPEPDPDPDDLPF